ncbi:hypothetical protein [Pectobacterium sp. A5351]|nr:hypothetical protein [Pectobacterium sp. A5351]WCG83848.1 hypothetical protein O1Q74_03875 [Pectobacterium sp. A5351]
MMSLATLYRQLNYLCQPLRYITRQAASAQKQYQDDNAIQYTDNLYELTS